eukprot:Polyplicarium_translucidae@DN2514_c0_g1_i1.p1
MLATDAEVLARDPKQTEDFAAAAEALLEALPAVTASAGRQEAVAQLLALEKQARQGSDGRSTSKLVCAALRLHKEAADWDELRALLSLLCKKRGQLKRAIVDAVQLCMGWVDPASTECLHLDTQLVESLLETLATLTEGKMFVEVERARVVKMMADLKEKEGNIEAAAKLMQEVQVETFGTMERREKTEYILEQMRLVLANGDFIRCQIVSKKISPKLLELEELEDLRIRYYGYMVRYYQHENDLLEVCRCCLIIFKSKSINDDESAWKQYLETYALTLILSPISDKRLELLQALRTNERKKLADLPAIGRVIEDFLQMELLRRPLPYEAELRATVVFADEKLGAERLKTFRVRSIEHDLIVLAAHYSRMHTSRAAELLGCSVAEVESQVGELVNSGALKAKMDRPADIVTFGETRSAAVVLDKWARDVSRILSLVEETNHLISKEKVVQDAKQQAQAALRAAMGEGG